MARLDYENQKNKEKELLVPDPGHLGQVAKHAKNRARAKAWRDAKLKSDRAKLAAAKTPAFFRGVNSGVLQEQERIIKLLKDNLGNMTAEVLVNLIKGGTK